MADGAGSTALMLPPRIADLRSDPRHPFQAASARWESIADGLGLGTEERWVGGVLLAALLDDSVRDQVSVGDVGQSPRVSDLIEFGGVFCDRAPLLGAIAQLDRRGLLSVSKRDGRVWTDGSLSFPRPVWMELLSDPRRAWAPPSLPLPPRLEAEAVRLVSLLTVDAEVTVVFRGPEGAGHMELLRHIATLAGWKRCEVLSPTRWRVENPLIPDARREVVVWDVRGHDDVRATTGEFLRRARGPVVVLANVGQRVALSPERAAFRVELGAESRTEHRHVWSAVRPDLADEDLARLAARIPLELGHAVAMARVGKVDEPSAEAQLERRATSAELLHVERRSVERGRLLLEPELSSAFDRWLELVVAHGHHEVERPGLRGLFAGPSGTGKTLAAQVTAATRRRPLARVDLSAVTSKWLGETEKNLRSAFETARALGAVLLIDEGDALLGARGDVDRGSDRYANMEVAYLLQAIESFDGICVVTTNLPENIDPAFARRFETILHFARPSGSMARTHWRRSLGPAVKEALIDWLVDRMPVSGGEIASIGVVARGLAVARGRREPTRAEVLGAIEDELRKTGGSLSVGRLREDFG